MRTPTVAERRASFRAIASAYAAGLGIVAACIVAGWIA